MSNKKPSDKARIARKTRLREIERTISALREERGQLRMDERSHLDQIIKETREAFNNSRKSSQIDGKRLMTPRQYGILTPSYDRTYDERRKFARTLSGLESFVKKNIGKPVAITRLRNIVVNEEYGYYRPEESKFTTVLQEPGIEFTEYDGIRLYTHGNVLEIPYPAPVVKFRLDPGDKLKLKSDKDVPPPYRKILLGKKPRRKRQS